MASDGTLLGLGKYRGGIEMTGKGPGGMTGKGVVEFSAIESVLKSQAGAEAAGVDASIGPQP